LLFSLFAVFDDVFGLTVFTHHPFMSPIYLIGYISYIRLVEFYDVRSITGIHKTLLLILNLDCRVIEMSLPIEINGYDETGIIGKYLRFVRVGMTVENSLRPFVYNLLHFRSVSATKRFLDGISDAIKIDYVKNAMADPAITISQYSFSTDHQIDILRKFTLLEEKTLFRKREEMTYALKNNIGVFNALENIAKYLRRYERVPFWMESFIKAYGFRMIVENLHQTSKVISNRRISDYRVISYVDGGFPFVFWWRDFLNSQPYDSRFSLQKTPIFGVTKGDEYYPTTSMAGNIAYITSTTSGMIYPQNIIELPRMNPDELNRFYTTFAETTSVPTFHKRVFFVGRLYRDFQYLIPFIMHIGSDYEYVYEPFRLKWDEKGTLKSFYRAFGKYPENDIVIHGPLQTENDKQIFKECESIDLECQNAQDLLGVYRDLLDKIEEQSEASNLDLFQRHRISKAISFAKQKAKDFVQ